MKERWQEIRQAAMDVLKPDKKVLEHGLELHRDSFVFDAYGFSPIGGKNAPRLPEIIESGAGRDELTCTAEEFSINAFFDTPENVQLLRQAWEFAGVDATFQNSGLEGNDLEIMLQRLSFYTYLTDKLDDFYERAVFPEQLPGIKSRGHKALYMTTNGVPLPTKLTSTADALTYIDIFFKLGVRMMHLTYNRRNLIGDGCAESSDAGLSAFGRQVIREMNRVGVIPDVAHSGQRTSLEAAEISSKPVVASHTAASALSTHYRGKRNEVIAAIKKSGGYVGICGHPPFLEQSMDLNAMLDHICYIVENFGASCVAIGTDNDTPLTLAPGNVVKPKVRPIWEQYWPEPGAGYEKMTKKQYDSVNWLNWPLFTVGLVQRGLNDDDIRQIIGGNVLRVINETIRK